jgi:glycine dehydrogenase
MPAATHAARLDSADSFELSQVLSPSDTFARRHIGPSAAEVQEMLAALGVESIDQLIAQAVPEAIRLGRELSLPAALTESGALGRLREIAALNKVYRSCIGQGYYDTIVPPVIQRNILENPGWYTQYTPYQAEIAQGRMEALLNFQTLVSDLTALPLANSSLLDEATAAAEAMTMARGIVGEERHTFLVSADCHPQTIAVVRTRAAALGIKVELFSGASVSVGADVFGVLVQYPGTSGKIGDYAGLAAAAHGAGALVIAAADVLALTLITPPGEWGADIAVGSTQRFGVPLGFGGPHAAYMATKPEYVRKMPGRLIGVSKDAQGNPALRLTLQTREQHIRRDKATSNICTAQVLLAVMAGMYATYHGPVGLKRIARRVHAMTAALAAAVERLGHTVLSRPFFDTITVKLNGDLSAEMVHRAARAAGFNLREVDATHVAVSFDETTTRNDVEQVIGAFAAGSTLRINLDELATEELGRQGKIENRTSAYLTHPIFNSYHTEHELLRYIHRLQSRDLSLTTSMIPLGSCTMKLNATAEMFPVSWAEFGKLHPYAPAEQTKGYQKLFADLEAWLSEITGFAAVSLQPNAGSAGEYAGLLAIRGYHLSRGDAQRDVCLIPDSAHGTNPASAVIAGFRVVAVKCDSNGNVDLADLTAKAEAHSKQLAALMVTYPSTHGVFETAIKDICAVVHKHGGQVYMDGANMNAQVGLCRPGDIGADVCHLNLHKTFCIPHGGGGPGMGPIGVAKHLVPFLPSVGTDYAGNKAAVGPVSAAPYGSASILVISWMYIAMMGATGLRRATEVAILSANYMAKRLESHYPVLFVGHAGRVAHEFIIDVRPFEATAGVKTDDIAKRLMDYGYHAPTMSWPVTGTLMIEPTESESKPELDRFCDAMISIRKEIAQVEAGALSKTDNPLKHAPHTAAVVTADEWGHGYSRQQAAYPAAWVRAHKFWPAVARVDNPYGDRNLVCTCAPLSDYAQ